MRGFYTAAAQRSAAQRREPCATCGKSIPVVLGILRRTAEGMVRDCRTCASKRHGA